MKKIHYQTKHKILCKFCRTTGEPYIRMIRFKNSKEYLCAAYCRKCNQFIENVPRASITIGR